MDQLRNKTRRASGREKPDPLLEQSMDPSLSKMRRVSMRQPDKTYERLEILVHMDPKASTRKGNARSQLISIEIGVDAIAQTAVDKLMQTLHFRSSDYFALALVDTRALTPQRYFAALTPISDIKQALANARPLLCWELWLKVVVYPKDLVELMSADAPLFEYLFRQITEDFLTIPARPVAEDLAVFQVSARLIKRYLMRSQLEFKKSATITERVLDSLHKEIGLTRFVPGYMLDSSAAKERAIKKSLLMILKQLVYNDVHSCTTDFFTFYLILNPDVSLHVRRCVVGGTDVDLLISASQGVLIRQRKHPPLCKLVCKFVELIVFQRDPSVPNVLELTFQDHSSATLSGSINTVFEGPDQVDTVLTVLRLYKAIYCPAERLRTKQQQLLHADQPVSGIQFDTPSASEDGFSIQEVDDFCELVIGDQVSGVVDAAIARDYITISFESLTFTAVLGRGAFGEVRRAVLHQPTSDIHVAVKSGKPDAEQGEGDSFVAEALLIQQFDHPYIIKLIGICESPRLIVLELMVLGELREYLMENSSLLKQTSLALTYCWQISSALEYLSKKNYIHRDLAARNVLVATPELVKLSDFGMSKLLREDGTVTVEEGVVPVKWMAPESINFRQYTSKSDVWMFAVCCWEILSYGLKPFTHIRNVDVIDALEGGERLSKPEFCDEQSYQLLSRCWSYESDLRPTFEVISKEFLAILGQQDILSTEAGAKTMLFKKSKQQSDMLAAELQEHASVDPFTPTPATQPNSTFDPFAIPPPPSFFPKSTSPASSPPLRRTQSEKEPLTLSGRMDFNPFADADPFASDEVHRVKHDASELARIALTLKKSYESKLSRGTSHSESESGSALNPARARPRPARVESSPNFLQPGGGLEVCTTSSDLPTPPPPPRPPKPLKSTSDTHPVSFDHQHSHSEPEAEHPPPVPPRFNPFAISTGEGFQPIASSSLDWSAHFDDGLASTTPAVSMTTITSSSSATTATPTTTTIASSVSAATSSTTTATPIATASTLSLSSPPTSNEAHDKSSVQPDPRGRRASYSGVEDHNPSQALDTKRRSSSGWDLSTPAAAAVATHASVTMPEPISHQETVTPAPQPSIVTTHVELSNPLLSFTQTASLSASESRDIALLSPQTRRRITLESLLQAPCSIDTALTATAKAIMGVKAIPAPFSMDKYMGPITELSGHYDSLILSARGLLKSNGGKSIQALKLQPTISKLSWDFDFLLDAIGNSAHVLYEADESGQKDSALESTARLRSVQAAATEFLLTLTRLGNLVHNGTQSLAWLRDIQGPKRTPVRRQSSETE